MEDYVVLHYVISMSRRHLHSEKQVFCKTEGVKASISSTHSGLGERESQHKFKSIFKGFIESVHLICSQRKKYYCVTNLKVLSCCITHLQHRHNYKHNEHYITPLPKIVAFQNSHLKQRQRVMQCTCITVVFKRITKLKNIKLNQSVNFLLL